MNCRLPTLLCPLDLPGKNTGVSCHFLLQEIFLTQGSNCVSCIAGGFFTHWATWETCIFPTREQSQEAHCRVSLSLSGRDQKELRPGLESWHGVILAPRFMDYFSISCMNTENLESEFSCQICIHSGTVWKAFLWPKNYFSVTHWSSTMRGLTQTRISNSLGVEWLYFW